MGRKKKSETEESLVNNPLTDEVKLEKSPELNEVAFGLHRVHTENGPIFELVEIKYDPKSGLSSSPKVIAKDVYEDIVDKFKIQAAEKLLTMSKD